MPTLLLNFAIAVMLPSIVPAIPSDSAPIPPRHPILTRLRHPLALIKKSRRIIQQVEADPIIHETLAIGGTIILMRTTGPMTKTSAATLILILKSLLNAK